MIWVLDHLADLESDLSRFHRIDDMYALDGPKFFRLVWRLSTYGGVMAMRLEQQQLERRAAEAPPSSSPRPAAGRVSRSTTRPLSAFMAQFPGLVEKTKAA